MKRYKTRASKNKVPVEEETREHEDEVETEEEVEGAMALENPEEMKEGEKKSSVDLEGLGAKMTEMFRNFEKVNISAIRGLEFKVEENFGNMKRYIDQKEDFINDKIQALEVVVTQSVKEMQDIDESMVKQLNAYEAELSPR